MLATVTTFATLTFAAAASAPTTLTTPAIPTAVQADLVLGSAVVNREAQPLPEKLLAGQTIYAVSQVTGPGGGFVEHVWTRDGKEVAHHYLPVGQSKRWRTWSRHKLGSGQYQVEVIGEGGVRLQTQSFTVEPAR